MSSGRWAVGAASVLSGAVALGACGSEPFNPPPVEAPFVAVAAGVLHTCGLTTTGRAYCWGWNDHGQLGDGSRSRRRLPVQVEGNLTFAEVSAGGAHTCGITTSGAPYCWGFNLSGQLGDSTQTGRVRPAAVRWAGALALVETGGAYTCGLAADSAAQCWGWGASGQLGRAAPDLCPTSTSNDPCARTPGAVTGGLKFWRITAGVQHSCALAADSTAWCWGKNGSGELGIGSQTDTTRPAPVSGGRRFALVTVGYAHTCAVDAAGDAYCWGDNTRGQLGDTTITSTNTPNAVLGGIRFMALTAGANHTCGLAVGGAAHCWGNDATGQLGSLPEEFCATSEGNLGCTRTPTPVSGGLSFTTITAGTHHTCAISIAQVAYCWGWNDDGQLGDGTSTLRVEPVPVAKQAGVP